MGIEVVQRDIEDWSRSVNRAVALFKFSPLELTERHQLSFSESYDDLDYFKVSVVELGELEEQIAFLRHKHNPVPGTQLWIHENADGLGTIKKVIEIFGWSFQDVLWISPDLEG